MIKPTKLDEFLFRVGKTVDLMFLIFYVVVFGLFVFVIIIIHDIFKCIFRNGIFSIKAICFWIFLISFAASQMSSSSLSTLYFLRFWTFVPSPLVLVEEDH